MSKWELHQVETLISEKILFIGDGYRAKNCELSMTGVPFARVSNINNGVLFDGADYFPIESLKRVGNKISQVGDVVFTSKGTVGRFAYVNEKTQKFVYSPQLCFWRVLNREKIEPQFLFYWIQSGEFYSQFNAVKGQTDMADYVSLLDQRRMYITLPPIHEQKRIAYILGALDDKIQINRQMNDTLEATARAIFQSWFVSFDPVHAKARGEMPYGMDAETADLFPDSFEENELGVIPSGWRVGTVGDLCINILSGGTPNTGEKDYWNGHIPWLSSGETREPFIVSTERTISDLGVKESSTRFVPSWSVVIAGAGQGQTRGQASLLMIDSYINQSTLALIPNLNKSNALYIFFNLSNRYEELRTISDSHSSRGSLTKILINSLGILQPIPECLFAFELIVKPMIEKISDNLMQIRTLTEIRDSLLQKLISGKIQLEGLYELV